MCPAMNSVEQAAELLRASAYTVALTGAGISTPSGIPDFRSHDSGLWQDMDPMQVASIWGFRQNPEAFFDWIRPLARLTLAAQPNPAHFALARMEQAGYLKAVITQNIDLLHTKAGSRIVYETHGSLRVATCIHCFREYETSHYIDAFLDRGIVPRCEHCGGILKPNVILFGEPLPAQTFNEARMAVKRSTVFLVAGSSLSVAPVSNFPLMAVRQGASLIIINREPTAFDDEAHVIIHGDVAVIFPELVQLMGLA